MTTNRTSVFSIIAAMLALLAAATAVAGGQWGGRGQGASIEDLAARLNLSDEQIPRVEAILAEAAEEREVIFESYAELSGREKMQALKPELQSLGEEIQAQLAQVLDHEQMAEYSRLRQERREQMRQRRGRGSRSSGGQP